MTYGTQQLCSITLFQLEDTGVPRVIPMVRDVADGNSASDALQAKYQLGI
jgi:hypothetical protein